jgi:hypothetical protein
MQSTVASDSCAGIIAWLNRLARETRVNRRGSTFFPSKRGSYEVLNSADAAKLWVHDVGSSCGGAGKESDAQAIAQGHQDSRVALG